MFDKTFLVKYTIKYRINVFEIEASVPDIILKTTIFARINTSTKINGKQIINNLKEEVLWSIKKNYPE